VQRGDTFPSLRRNGIAIFEAHFGVPMLRCRAQQHQHAAEPATVSYILAHCEARVLLVDTEVRRNWRARPLPISTVRRLWWYIVDRPGRRRSHRGAGIRGTSSKPKKAAWCDRASRPANCSQSHSITRLERPGGPKGVVYDHRNAFVESIGNMLSLGAQGDVVTIWAVPIFHANGWCYVWPMTGIGACNVLLRRPTGKGVLQAIADHDGTHVLGAPIIAQLMAEVPQAERPAFAHPVRMLTAGAPPTPAHFVAMEELGVQLDQGYGLTEVWGPAIFRTPDSAWSKLSPLERGR